jgi:zinc/manganese transport system substrate-binding protein
MRLRCLQMIGLVLAGWLVPLAQARAELRVVATTSDLAAISAAVGGSNAKVVSLALPTQDPHFVDPRPHLALDLARADLLVLVGLDLEVGWLPTLQLGSRNSRIMRGGSGYLDCSTVVQRLEVPQGPVDRSMGDVHPGGSPHYMLDPRRAAKVAEGIAARMADLDPTHAASYRENLARLLRELDAGRARWEKALAPLRGRPVIGYHRSLGYLADWLGLVLVEHLEPRPGVPPNPRHLAQVLTLAKSRGVRLFLQETYYPTNASQTLAQHAGAVLVQLRAAPDFDHGESYVKFMDALVAKLAGAAR